MAEKLADTIREMIVNYQKTNINIDIFGSIGQKKNGLIESKGLILIKILKILVLIKKHLWSIGITL
jgi:hypothetical protein